MSEGLDEDAPGYQAADSSLFDKGELNDWGNLPQYYMVQYVDLETGEKLEKPIVTVFTVDSEVKNAPRVTLGINEEGFPVFRWKKSAGSRALLCDEHGVLRKDGIIRRRLGRR